MVTVIGGGLAGCEAAWQAARCGVDVELYEMRPQRSGPAHKTGALAELVCSNSLRGASLDNAVGLLKEELARIDSIVVGSAREAAVPAGGALAVDRERFAAAVEARLGDEPQISVRREEVRALPQRRPLVVACGPLPTEELLAEIDAALVAAAPADGSRRLALLRRRLADRRGRIDRRNARCTASRATRKATATTISTFRSTGRSISSSSPICARSIAINPKTLKTATVPRYFEGCLPIEEMADRGEDTLRFGPLKPVGLRDPRTGKTPYAVVQLRKENVAGTAFNLVGFQTRLTWPAQKAAFGKLPGLQRAEWLRLGVMHRNTFLDSPRLLDANLMLRGSEGLYFAGQITGAEGYVEAAACGAMAGIAAARACLGLPALEFPRESAFGAVVAHLQNAQTHDFQPANVTWAPFPPLGAEIRDKRLRREAMAERALAAIDAFAARLWSPG